MPRQATENVRPTLGNKPRRIMAAMIQAKLPGTKVDWTSGHGVFSARGKVFCTITREGDLALKLSPERMEELIGLGEAKPRQFGARVMKEWMVVPVTDPAWALELLREAKAHAETQAKPKRKAAKT